MKAFCALIFFSILFRFVSAQNLIVNPSFEDTSNCPLSPGQISLANNWLTFSETPDYYNACSPSCQGPNICVGVPENIGGYQQPFEGSAYAGFTTYFKGNSNFREVIACQLVEPLQIGKKYFVSAYISRGNGFFTHAASNNIGFRFSNVSYSYANPIAIDNFSHIHEDTLVTDSINWLLIKGSFTADSNYTFLAIGNFYDSLHTDTIDVDTSATYDAAYYYIDQVCVTPDSGNCSPFISGQNNLNVKNFTIQLKNEELIINNPQRISADVEIFSISGQKVFKNRLASNMDIFDVHDLPSQIYILKIIFNQEAFVTKLFKQN